MFLKSSVPKRSSSWGRNLDWSRALSIFDAYLAYEEMGKEVGTNCSIAYVRHTIDTRDEFYEKESDYLDEIYPALQELNQKIEFHTVSPVCQI